MAAASLSPLPQTLSTMSTRRVPLSSKPNAVNSPYRAVAAAAATKSKRPFASAQQDDGATLLGPPAKKQMTDGKQTPQRQHPTQSAAAEARVFARKQNPNHQTAFERRCVAAREKPVQQVVTKTEKGTGENLDTVRQWQKHYRKIFPKFVFYFESVPEDARLKCTKHVIALGAREEKFFSNAVTHVVTTRAIPPEDSGNLAEPAGINTASNEPLVHDAQLQTINPSLLDRSPNETTHIESFGSRAKFTFEAPLSKRMAIPDTHVDTKRQQSRNADVLQRARTLGMKIWALEKIQRMMTTMFETETGYSNAHSHNTRSVGSVKTGPNRVGGGADLSQLLRLERIHGQSDRDPTVATQEMQVFKGPFIYVHDIDAKQRPILLREYAKVTHKEDGDWPQFRSVPQGKCPFIEEIDHSRREAEKEKEHIRLMKQKEMERSVATRTRTAATSDVQMRPPGAIRKRIAMDETKDILNRGATVSSKQINPFDKPRPHAAGSESSSRSTQNAFISHAAAGRLMKGEPVASGVQPSNITSAIRSQMVSSTAAQPGAKAGTNKEIHGLQRKVLERNNGGPGSYNTSSHRTPELSGTVKEEAAARPSSKRKVQEMHDLMEEDHDAMRAEKMRRSENPAVRRADRATHRDPKPGYCENCQDKFADFEEHIQSRKHRKFADKAENWLELDGLLRKLRRPLRREEPSIFSTWD